uniref:Putative secreted protein n=1 Tax=Anopheles marajoara TaxID=58244 RepID=A0A2M4C5L0_9DIPT
MRLLVANLLVLFLVLLRGLGECIQSITNLPQLILLLHQLFLLLGHLEQWLHLSVQAPPLPVTQLQVGGTVALNNTDRVQLLQPLLVVAPSQKTTAVRLEVDDQVRDLVVALLLEMGQHTSPEEDLRLSDAVQIAVQFERFDHLLAGPLAIHESLRNDVRRQQFVALAELLEWDTVRETLAADTDTLEHTIAPQLIQHQRSIDLARSLLVVGDDATHKVRIRVAQRVHQFGQLFLVQMGNRTEHTLAGTCSELGVGEGLLRHADNLRILPDLHNERILGSLQE